MEPIAENKVTITKKLLLEGRGRIFRDVNHRLYKRVFLVLAGVWLLTLIVTLAARLTKFYVIWELVVILAVALWLCVYIPRDKTKRAFRNLEGRGDLSRVTRFYGDHMEVSSGGGSVTDIPYDQVKEILQSRRLLILTCENNTAVMLALDGFTSGDAELVMNTVRKALPSGEGQ